MFADILLVKSGPLAFLRGTPCPVVLLYENLLETCLTGPNHRFTVSKTWERYNMKLIEKNTFSSKLQIKIHI